MKSVAKPTSTRRLITGALTLAAQSYWLYKGFSCFTEIGLASWGKLRADFVALSLSTDVIICEIKSSRADYATDKKWRNYLQHCNSMYFVMMPDTWLKLRDRMEEDGVFEAGVGVLILDPATGYLKCVKHCVRRPISGPAQRAIVTRLAWRTGISKRTSQRVRQFVDVDSGVVTSSLRRSPVPDPLGDIFGGLLDPHKKKRRRRKRRFSKTKAARGRKRVYSSDRTSL